MKNKELKDFFEKKYKDKSARKIGTFLGYLTSFYVVSAIFHYQKYHPSKDNNKPIKLKQLAKWAYLRPTIVRESDGLRFYRLLELTEKSGVLKIESRRRLIDGSIGVIVTFNPKAKLEDYEVQWSVPPREGMVEFAESIGLKDWAMEFASNDTGYASSFWKDGWTEYDANFLLKGAYRMLLNAAEDDLDKETLKARVTSYRDNLESMLTYLEAECLAYLKIIQYRAEKK